MKKLLSIILAVIISMSCVGCGTNGIDKTVYESGVKALEVFDSYYFDMEISNEEAREKLDVLEKRTSTGDEFDYLKKDYSDRIDISHKIAMMNIYLLGTTEDKALKERNDLAKILGKSTR